MGDLRSLLEKWVDQNSDDEDEDDANYDFDLYDRTGGQIDEAYDLGIRSGYEQAVKYVHLMLKKTKAHE